MNSTYLFLHNVGYVLSSLLLVGLIVSIFIKDHRTTANKMIIWAFFAVLIFTTAHLVGVNVSDPYLSRAILTLTSSVLFISCFFAHSIFAMIGKLETQKIPLRLMYSLSTLLFAVFIFFPDTFLHVSEPKMYFPNYYVAGSLYWLMEVISNGLIPAYFLFQMIRAYREGDFVMKNRLKYLFAALLLGYSFGVTAVPLVFGFIVNPIWSVLFVPFFTIPFAYAVLKYELMDIRVIAKQAFLYAVSVVAVGLFISLFNYANNLAIARIPELPAWLFPLGSSVLAVSVGFFVWKKLRETDFLKYEFINVVTHKFRTPLTHIKWSTDNLFQSTSQLSPNDRESLQRIQSASQRLVDLTNLLVNLSDAGTISTSSAKAVSIDGVIRAIVSDYQARAREKGVSIRIESSTSAQVLFDEAKFAYIIQILLNNALKYTPSSGEIFVTVIHEKKTVTLCIKDTGIGLSREDAARIFTKFFRTDKAMRIDTEGLGIDLFMAKQIVEKQGGKMWVQSAGEGQGTSFFVQLPTAKKVS